MYFYLKYHQKLFRLISVFLVLLIIQSMALSSIAHAAMVSSQELFEASNSSSPRSSINILLQRNDVKNELVLMGVDLALVQARVDGMTDQEIIELVGMVDDKEAGGSFLLGVVAGFLSVFIYILSTFSLSGIR